MGKGMYKNKDISYDSYALAIFTQICFNFSSAYIEYRKVIEYELDRCWRKIQESDLSNN